MCPFPQHCCSSPNTRRMCGGETMRMRFIETISFSIYTEFSLWKTFLSPLRCINNTTNIKYGKSVDYTHIHTRSIIPPLKHSAHLANFLQIQPCVTRPSIKISLIFPKFIRFQQSKLRKNIVFYIEIIQFVLFKT